MVLEIQLDESVERFLADCTPGTRDTYRPALRYFSDFLRGFEVGGEVVGTPTRFLDLVSADQALPVRQKRFIARAIVKGFGEFLKQDSFHFAPKGILTRVGAVQSFSKYFEVPISTKYADLPDPLVQTKSYAWTRETFGRFVGLMDTKMYRSQTALLFQSGLGIGDVLGLVYGDVAKQLEAGVVPVCLDFTMKGRGKTGVPHHTFIGPEAISLLKDYLAERGGVGDGDLLFPVRERSVEGYFATRVVELIGEYEGRNPAGPHSLRKFFRKSVVNAGAPESYAEYWMGHNMKADLRKTYTAMSAEEWAVEYAKYMPALSFQIVEGDSESKN